MALSHFALVEVKLAGTGLAPTFLLESWLDQVVRPSTRGHAVNTLLIQEMRFGTGVQTFVRLQCEMHARPG